MPKRKSLGEFEHLVLLAVARLNGSGYGATLRQELEDRTGREVSVGALYATLDRLAEKGYVASRPGQPEPDRGGRPKRYYALTGTGEDALAAARLMLERMWEGVALNRGVSS